MWTSSMPLAQAICRTISITSLERYLPSPPTNRLFLAKLFESFTWECIFSQSIEIRLNEVLSVVRSLEGCNLFPQTWRPWFLAFNRFCWNFRELNTINNLHFGKNKDISHDWKIKNLKSKSNFYDEIIIEVKNTRHWKNSDPFQQEGA